MLVDLLLCVEFSAVSIWISATDLRNHRIPDPAIITLAAMMVVTVLFTDRSLLAPRLIAAAGGYVIFRLIHLASGGRLGLGDVKYSVCIGFFLGIVGWYLAVTAASILGIGWFLLLRLARKRDITHTPLPFAPFLFAGSVVSFVLTHTVIVPASLAAILR